MKKKKVLHTHMEFRSDGVTAKITVMMPRELWARVRSAAVRRGTTAQALLTEATENMMEKWEKEERR